MSVITLIFSAAVIGLNSLFFLRFKQNMKARKMI